MRFYLILFFCVSLFFACGSDSKTDSVPAEFIQLHQMAALLTDIHIVDGSLANVSPQPDTLAKHGLGLYLAVFKAHSTDSATFRKSLKYYSAHPDLMGQVYAGINFRLTNKLDSLNKIKPKIDPDSIKRAKLKASADSISRVKATAKFDSLRKHPLIVPPNLLKNRKLPKQNALSVK